MRVSSAALPTSRARAVCGAVRIGAPFAQQSEPVRVSVSSPLQGFVSGLALPATTTRLPGTSGCACS